MLGAQAQRLVDVEGWGPLPLKPGPKDMREWLAIRWWKESLTGTRASMSFAMIGRLAQAIIVHNPNVLKALQLTYSHVFLDEFQDTTRTQFDLTTIAFANSPSVLTAVGDTKQRIMTWAGAEAEVFSWFEKGFEANRERLQTNHRSNKRIVQIINDLVTEIEPDAVETLCARSDDEVPDDAAIFWTFRSDEAEAQWLANFIADDIAGNIAAGRCPDDFALLVRLRADQTEKRLQAAFVARGLRLRNEARPIGTIPIQDLMSDELACLVLGFVRIALGVRSKEIYDPVRETLSDVLGVAADSAMDMGRLDQMFRSVITLIRERTRERPTETDMKALVGAVVAEIGAAPLRRRFRQYESAAYFLEVQSALADLMAEQSQAADWTEVIDAVEGKGQVRLMTVHKSKGLEYHTVIFVGLHENSFFGYRNNRQEETNAFFVALSRARERVFFTRSDQGGQVAQIQGLVDLLTKAKVPVVGIAES